MGLGPWPAVSLAKARKLVDANREQLASGIDPIDERRREKVADTLAKARSITFDAAAEAYIAGNEAKWRNGGKNAGQWRASLKTYASPILGRLPLADIKTDHVVRVLRPIWTTKVETAVRVRGRIETVLAYGIAQGWVAEPNCARWHNHLQMILPARSKVAPVVPHAALDWKELPEFMDRLQGQDGFGAWALQFAILTAARSGEVRGCTWDEIDLDTAVWAIPGGRMKASREHKVPLSSEALAVIHKAAAVRGESPFVFPGMNPNRPLSDMSILAVLKRIGRTDITTHGMRATFKTWASDRTEHAREVIEASLSHVVGDKAEQAYQRGSWFERRRKLMDEWSAFACSPPGANVIPLARAV
jgi:integrase